MSVFLSSAYIHSELHLLGASSVLYTDPMNLQYFTLYQNPDIIRKKNCSLISLGVKEAIFNIKIKRSPCHQHEVG